MGTGPLGISSNPFLTLSKSLMANMPLLLWIVLTINLRCTATQWVLNSSIMVRILGLLDFVLKRNRCCILVYLANGFSPVRLFVLYFMIKEQRLLEPITKPQFRKDRLGYLMRILLWQVTGTLFLGLLRKGLKVRGR